MKTYATKSNARRAAKAAGIENPVIVERDGGFAYLNASAMNIEPEAPVDPYPAPSAAQEAALRDAGVGVEPPEKGGKSMQQAAVELASRPEGASVAELNELTGWSGAGWAGLFTHPLHNWAGKRGLSMRKEREGRSVRYFLTPSRLADDAGFEKVEG